MPQRHGEVPGEALLVSPKKARQLLGVGNTQLYEILRRGELKSFRIGRSRKITRQSIDDYVGRKLAEIDGAEPQRRAQRQPAAQALSRASQTATGGGSTAGKRP